MKRMAQTNHRGARGARLTLTALAAILLPLLPTALGAGYVNPWAEEFAEVEIFFEENASDGDLGIHIFWDGEPWRYVTVIDPGWRRIFTVRNDGRLGRIGSTELFTESNEPSFDDISREEFLEHFREGEYRFYGRTIEGRPIFGIATLSRVLPEPPEIVAPEEDEVVEEGELVIVAWETVPDPPGEGNEIVGYQIVVEQEEPLRVFSVDMPPDANMVTVPPEFLQADLETKVEIIVRSANGNKTISEHEFQVE